MKTGIKPDKKFSKDKFTYDPYKDEFTCPLNEKLVLKGVYNYNEKIQHVYYGANCSKCPDRLECANNRVKIITSNEYEPERQRMAQKMQTKEACDEYTKRKETVEFPFGNIKHNLKFTEFLMHGITGTKIEGNLLSFSHNSKRIWNEMKHNLSKIFQIKPKTQITHKTNNKAALC